MTLALSIPGLAELVLEHLLVDVNGTLTNRGELLDGVEARLGRLSNALDIRLVSADTFGTLDTIAARMNVSAALLRYANNVQNWEEYLGSTVVCAGEQFFGALRTAMATCGYETVKEFQKAEVMVAPSLQTEGKFFQRSQGVGMGH